MAMLKKCLVVVFFLELMTSTCWSSNSEYIQCYQCNMRQQGVTNVCPDKRLMKECIGCMKTVTKVKIRDSGFIDGRERLSVVTSRYCMRKGATNVKKEGCYKQMNNGGYTERCFCYSDLCNAGVTLTFAPATITMIGLASVTSVISAVGRFL